MKISTSASLCLALLLATPVLAAERGAPALDNLGLTEKTVRVDCGGKRTLEQAMRFPAERLTIEFSGVCEENVLILRDHVTLRGVSADAALVGDPAAGPTTIEVRGAQDVSLANFAIADGRPIGILFRRGASGSMSGLNITDPGFAGILVDQGSSAVLINTKVTGSGVFGISVLANSSLTVAGVNEASDNGAIGLLLSTGSGAQASGAGRFIANRNGSSGVSLQLMASAAMPALEAHDNGFAGLDMVFGGFYTGFLPVDLRGNGMWGLRLGKAGQFVGGGIITGNTTAGIFAAEDSRLTMITDLGAEVTGNPTDLIVDDSAAFLGGVTFGSIELIFDSNLTVNENVTIASLLCDDTSLVRGDTCDGAPDAVRATFDEPAALHAEPPSF